MSQIVLTTNQLHRLPSSTNCIFMTWTSCLCQVATQFVLPWVFYMDLIITLRLLWWLI